MKFISKAILKNLFIYKLQSWNTSYKLNVEDAI